MSADWAFSVLAARATVVLLVAAAASVLLGRASAATRHASFTSAVLVLLALPWLSLALPTLDLPVLPAPAAPISAPAGASDPGVMDEEPALSVEPSALAEPPAFDTAAAVEPTSPAAVHPPSHRPSLSMALLALWAIGASAGVLQLAVSAFFVRRIARRAAPIENAEWHTALSDASAQLGLRRPVRLVTSPSVVVPVVWGYRRGVVMLPSEADAWPADRKRAFLLHELAHVARHDCLTQAFAHLARAVYWPHPLVWWAVRRLRAEAERACDDRVVTAGNPGAEYAHHLLEAARALKRAPRPLAVLAIAERSSLEDRLLALLDPGLRRGALTPRALAFGVVMSVALAGSVAVLQPVARAVLAPEPVPAAIAEETAPSSLPSAEPGPALAEDRRAVHGIVTDARGKPIANALVLVAPPWNPRNSQDNIPPEATRTDVEGRFRLLPRRTAPEYWLRVEAEGLLSATRSEAKPDVELLVPLGKGATTVEGTVLDAVTKSPVAGATVSATEVGVSFLPPVAAPDAGKLLVRTDAQGHYRFTGLGGGAYHITAGAPRYGYVYPRTAQGHTPVLDFFLPPAGALEGTITAPDGLPIKGAAVRAEDEALMRGTYNRSSVTTDARGRYEMGVPTGRYRVLVEAEGQAPTVSAPVSVQTGTRAHADVRLSEPFRVRGRLVDPSQKPVRGTVRLVALDGTTGAGARIAQRLSADAGADGRFEIAFAPGGSHVFAVASPGLATRELDVRLDERGGVKDIGDVALAGGAVIRGRVEDKNGTPIPGAAVFADRDRRKRESTRALADGTFAIGGLEAGTYDVRAEAYGFASAIEKSETGKGDVVVRLERTGGVTGVVVDEAGRTVLPRHISTEPQANRGARAPIMFRAGPEASEGRFILEDMVAGPYEVTVRADSFASQTIRVEVQPGRVTDAGRITLSRGRTASGIVVDGGGRPVAGATVDGGGNSVTTDGSGRFEIQGLPAGRTSLRASRADQWRLRSEPVEVADPAGGVRLVLFEGGRLVGRVRWRKPGTPFPITVRISSLPRPLSYTRSAAIGDDGSFVLEGLGPGRASVTLLANEERDFHPALAGKDVMVEEGATTAVDFDVADVRLYGRILRGGVPLAGAQIGLATPFAGGTPLTSNLRYLGPGIEQGSLPERLRAVTDAEGRYEMIVPVAGSYQVHLWSGSRVSLPSALRTVDVPPADQHAFDIAFTEALLRGRVLDDGTGKPVAEARVTAGDAWVVTDADGRFEVLTLPGRQTVRVRATPYATTDTDVDIAEDGNADTTVRLPPGVTLIAQVVDDKGQPVASASVLALAANGAILNSERGGEDGVVRVPGLPRGGVTVVVIAERHGFAVHRDIRPGPEPVSIAIVSGKRVRFAVKDAGGRPLVEERLFIQLSSLDGVKVPGINLRGLLVTDAEGVIETMVPKGSAELTLRGMFGARTGELSLDDTRDGAVVAATFADRR